MDLFLSQFVTLMSSDSCLAYAMDYFERIMNVSCAK